MDLQAQIQAAIALADSYPIVHEKLNDALTLLTSAQDREAASSAEQESEAAAVAAQQE